MYEDYAIFQNLNTTQRENFIAACTLKTYAAGHEIMSRGNHGENVFFLTRGTMRVLLPDRGELALLEPPAVAGEMELLTGRPRSATVIAVTDVEALAMPFGVMRGRIADGDVGTLKVIHNIAVVLATRLAKSVERLVQIEAHPNVRTDELQDFRKKLFSDWSF
jgi:CRP-like cAMP-binding protein